MKRTTVLLAVLAASALLVGAAGAVAAQPGNADDTGEREGPPGDLPDPVPDFVGDILDAVRDFVSGDGPTPGDVIPDLVSGR